MNEERGPIRIGYCMSLSGPLGSNGRSALLAHKIWEADVNAKGGLLGRPVQLICRDDQTNSAFVPGIYTELLDAEKVDLVIGGYGTNTLVAAMPTIVARGRFLVGLMGLGVNNELNYPNYFAMIPTGPDPNVALSEGFFKLAARQEPKPSTVALIAADAEFSRNPIIGAKANAKTYGMRIVSEHGYPLSASDFEPLLQQIETANPDLLFICSYLSDSVALVRAISAWRFSPKLVGGAMIGPQNTAVKTALGPLLNGFVNYDYWLPVPKMMFNGIEPLMNRYQAQAAAAGVDLLGYYMVPQAYAQMQVIEQAVTATGSLKDSELAHYTRHATFHTVLGDVAFGERGEWVAPRVVQVQFQNITTHDISEFKGARTQVVVAPDSFASGKLIYPYAAARE